MKQKPHLLLAEQIGSLSSCFALRCPHLANSEFLPASGDCHGAGAISDTCCCGRFFQLFCCSLQHSSERPTCVERVEFASGRESHSPAGPVGAGAGAEVVEEQVAGPNRWRHLLVVSTDRARVGFGPNRARQLAPAVAEMHFRRAHEFPPADERSHPAAHAPSHRLRIVKLATRSTGCGAGSRANLPSGATADETGRRVSHIAHRKPRLGLGSSSASASAESWASCSRAIKSSKTEVEAEEICARRQSAPKLVQVTEGKCCESPPEVPLPAPASSSELANTCRVGQHPTTLNRCPATVSRGPAATSDRKPRSSRSSD